MKMLSFATRSAKEMLRDPLNIIFGLGFPTVLLLLLSAIQANIPVELFEIESLSPGISVFGLSFITLFSATLIAKDRESALLERLYTTPLTPVDFILGYLLPLIPMAVAQTITCYTIAIMLGLDVSANILIAILFIIPIAFLYIALGLLFGSILSVKQVGGVCGALLTNLSAWLSGVWFDLKLVGGAFERIARYLPFLHAVELERAIIIGDINEAMKHILTVLLYGVVAFVLAVILFLKQMKNN